LVTLAFWHPAAGSQESLVHVLPSLQTSGEPARHVPVPQVSAPLQALPSVHEMASVLNVSCGQLAVAPLHFSSMSQAPSAGRQTRPALPAGWAQAPAPSQLSTVQACPSSVQGVPDVLKPSVGHVVTAPVHCSAVSHSPAAGRQTVPALPAGCAHWPDPLHTSDVQGRLSAVHAVPLALNPSGGQTEVVPPHVSAVSHSLAAARHVAPALPGECPQVAEPPLQASTVQGLPSVLHATPGFLNPSTGHAAALPGHVSARSHSPADGRHSVPVRKPSAGQLALEPVHCSAVSQIPADPRHTVPAFPAGCWHAELDPLHSSTVQGLLSVEQAVPPVFFTSGGQAAVPPAQVSARSHSPAATRQLAPDDAYWSAGQLLPPAQVSAMSQPPAEARHS